MLYTAAIFLAFFLAFVLFTKRGRSNADNILACWLLIMGIHLAVFYCYTILDSYYYPYLLIGYPLALFHGPMLYLYTASVTNQHVYLKKYWVWHFVPVVLIYGLMAPFFLLSHAEKLQVYANRGQGYEFVMLTQKILVMFSGVVYVLLSLWILHKHRQIVRDRFSQLEKINLAWLRYLSYDVGLVWLAVFFGNDLIIFSLVAVSIILIGYFGVKQVGIFTQPKAADITEPVDTISDEQETKTKYLKSALPSEALQEIHYSLTTLMEQQKLFLNPELTINELADMLRVHPSRLSQVINTVESKTFYDYINGKRVEEFKRKVILPENHKYTLMALAYECGFNSKTAFYRNFKSTTGLSPTDYIRQNRIQMS